METATVLAYEYPIMGAFLTMMWFFVWVIWLFLLFRIFADIFRSDDMGGFSKALWLIFVIFFPFLGVFVYLIARGKGMTERDIARAQAQDAAMASYVQNVAGSGGVATELSTLADLKERGVITEAEFNQQKAQLLG
jgi:uncharacterized membrane protein